jgi:murein DD-endopeptidase MepM/ murein hydrolase activator NlpD
MKKAVYVGLAALGLAALVGVFFYLRRAGSPRDQQVMEWINHPGAHPEWAVAARQQCANAPFILPTSGLIGYLWRDTFEPFHPHQGIDIFAPTSEVGETPVYAAYDGFLTRLADWKSSLIIRIPNDPLQPQRQIWTYYTHMANAQGNSFISPDFPPGSSNLPVKAGTLLGYQGNYSGNPADPVGVHLHFSIVKDNGKGNFLNELDINNTLDPSLYLGINLNADIVQDTNPILCTSTSGGGQ